ILDPTLAILDETDSGLDIDALKIVSRGVNAMRSPDRSMLVVTHYQRLLNYIVPDVVHVLTEGRIVRSGGKGLALELEEKGYGWLEAAAGAVPARAKWRGVFDTYIAEVERACRAGARDEPNWLMTARRRAAQRFREVGFPTSRAGEWRFR